MEEVLITTEDDGSQWVMLEDYQSLQQKYLLGELSLEESIKRNGELLRQVGDAKELLYSIHETVSVDCKDVGETFAGMEKDIAKFFRGLTPRALDSASVPPVEGWKPSGNVQLGQDADESPSQ